MRRLLAVLAMGAVAACGSDSSTAPSATVQGTWSLQTINGVVLPYVLTQSGANKIELISDVFTLGSGASFTRTSTARTTTNGVVSTSAIPDSGLYAVSGSAVIIHSNSDGSSSTASWSGNTITIAESGLALIYTR